MRHLKKFNHLGRTSSHRKAMLSNMAASLILHKRITTTVAKAKALRSYIEPLITRSKEDTTHSRRIVFSYLQNKQAVTELFREISPKVADRPGGYTRIIKTDFRHGDSADMCIMELVDFNEIYGKTPSVTTEKQGRRRRRGSGKQRKEKETVSTTPPSDVQVSEQEKVSEEPTVSEPETSSTEESTASETVAETPSATADNIDIQDQPEEENKS